MIYIPTENEAGMRLDFLASLSREGDRALGFPEVSLPNFGGSRRAVEGVAQGEVNSEEPNEYIPSKCINMQNNFMNIH